MEFAEDRVKLALAPREVRFYESVGSTNDAAQIWLSENAPHGAVVVADEQTQGRGRYGRVWHTPPGTALALSVILKPGVEHISQINMAATLAVLETLRAANVSGLTIKWANDVLVNGLKISGVLPEAVWDGNTLKGVILGIGLNVRNQFTGTELENTAVTLEDVIQREIDRVSLLTVLLFRLDQWLSKLGTQEVLDSYKRHMTMLGNPVTVKALDGTKTEGFAQDVDKDGALIIQPNEGDIVRVLAGDVTVVSYQG